jgi:multidrug resistance efflux pump
MSRGALDTTIRNVIPADVEKELGLIGREPNQVVCRIADYCAQLRADLAAAQARHRTVALALGKAAQEIHCAGPVDHRIRVLRRQLSAAIETQEARAEAAETQLTRLREGIEKALWTLRNEQYQRAATVAAADLAALLAEADKGGSDA